MSIKVSAPGPLKREGLTGHHVFYLVPALYLGPQPRDEILNTVGGSMNEDIINDNGGRRSGIDRREFSYSEHIPERRSVKDRRSGIDRRTYTNEDKVDTESRSFLNEARQLLLFERVCR